MSRASSARGPEVQLEEPMNSSVGVLALFLREPRAQVDGESKGPRIGFDRR
jgi:hypothetical protein